MDATGLANDNCLSTGLSVNDLMMYFFLIILINSHPVLIQMTQFLIIFKFLPNFLDFINDLLLLDVVELNML